MNTLTSLIRILLITIGITTSGANFASEVVLENKINLSFSQGKSRLLEQCLRVVAEYYNVSLAEAEIQAAKTWGNPLFVWNADMYSHEWNEYFHMGNQTLVQVEYALTVSGERVHTIRQANLGAEIAKLAFEDVVRGLVMEYSESYTNLFLLNEKKKVYQSILEKYSTLIASYEKRLDLGVISFNDLLRLKSELIRIKTEAIQNENEIVTVQTELNTLLNFPATTVIETEEQTMPLLDSLSAGKIIALARTYRPDFQLSQKNISYYQQMLKVQKAQAMPSINFGYQPRDKGSNYVRPYSGLVIEMSLPLFDRNQAGIQTAQIEIEQSKTELQIFEIGLDNEAFSAYTLCLNNKKNLENYSDEFINSMDVLSNSLTENFERKNISLLEFLDYQQTFIDSKMNYLEMKSMYLKSINHLNFVVGKTITN
jgi:cobalt-zinc-cadmium efflux system outer membrane protein